MSDARSRFFEAFYALKEKRMPDTQRQWVGLPVGYRNMVFRQARVEPRELKELTEDERQKLFYANQQIAQLAADAGVVLGHAIVRTRPRQG